MFNFIITTIIFILMVAVIITIMIIAKVAVKIKGKFVNQGNTIITGILAAFKLILESNGFALNFTFTVARIAITMVTITYIMVKYRVILNFDTIMDTKLIVNHNIISIARHFIENSFQMEVYQKLLATDIPPATKQIGKQVNNCKYMTVVQQQQHSITAHWMVQTQLSLQHYMSRRKTRVLATCNKVIKGFL